MRLRHLALAPALILVVTACSGTGSTASPTGVAASPSPAASAGAASASAAAQRIEVKLTDALKMDPAEMSVKAGQPVTFVVTNAGAIDHEFYLGDEAMQADQEKMMQAGQMAHDTAEGISLMPGETKELTYTFDTAGQTIAGCHVTGHYAAGMKATITITP
jgi:uncharacterized cupredoxin-like copper-binding protein